nr:PREDICTED: zingipain-2-like [Latimeria chalumnae]|eukprot:XP_014339789.1 PREDICTED: zingipain-2-like [Latimeria chalumnae]
MKIKSSKLSNERSMAKEVERGGPIAIIIDITKEFHKYNKGIFNEAKCNGKGKHAIMIVGFGTENGTDYWIIKNSWGKKWGEKGYARIKRNVNMCNLKQYAFKADVKAT